MMQIKRLTPDIIRFKCTTMNDEKQIRTITDIVHISPGHPFRGSIKDDPGGIARVVLMRSVDEAGGIDWSETVRTTPAGRRKPDWLKREDVIFLARGNRTIAATIDDAPGRALISPHFYLMRIKPDAPMLPSFLAWQINQKPIQDSLGIAAEGTAQRSIRRAALEKLSLAVPPLEVQQRVVALVNAAKAETKALKKLIANRERMLKAVALDILT